MRFFLLSALIVAAAAAYAEPPGNNYMLHCQGCHLPDGSGSQPDVPGLNCVAELTKIPNGRRYLIQVPGVAQSTLSDADLAVLLNWIVARFSAEEKAEDFKPYTAEEITGFRENPLLNAHATRNSLAHAGYDTC